MADLEEGEIVDSDTEEISTVDSGIKTKNIGDADNVKPVYSLPPRSSFNFVDIAPKQPLSSFTKMNHSGYRTKGNRTASSDDDSSNSDEDTDLWKCKKAKYFSKSKEKCMELNTEICSPPRTLRNSSGHKGMEEDSGEDVDAPSKKRKKVNNIWGSVLTEQTLTQGLIDVGVKNEDVMNSDRNVEKYDFTKAREDTRPHLAFEIDTSRQTNDPFENVIANFEEDGDEQKERRGQKRRRPVKERLNIDYDRDSVKQSSRIEATEEDSEGKVVNAILKSLDEPNVDLFTRIVNNVGKKKALDIAHRTEDVEEAGGLLTFDGKRRRTPGGTYIQLLKKEITQEQNKAIFAEDENKYRQNQKKRRKEKQKRAKELRKMLPQSKYTNQRNRERNRDKCNMDVELSDDGQKNDSEEDTKGDNSMELKVNDSDLNGSKTDVHHGTLNQSNNSNISLNNDDCIDIEIGENDTID